MRPIGEYRTHGENDLGGTWVPDNVIGPFAGNLPTETDEWEITS